MFAPITEALVIDGQISAQQTVLDVATGPGEPALSLAAVVGPQGKVIGVDPIPEMIAAARRAAVSLGLRNVQFEVASADHLPFADNTFEATVSRLGAMFFPSPVDGIREMLRVVKPGRRLALAVWHSADRNPFHHILSNIVDRYVDPSKITTDSWDAFRFAPARKLLEVLVEAGAIDTAERVLEFNIDTPLSAQDFWTLRLAISDKFRGAVTALSPEKAAEVQREVVTALEKYWTGSGISFPSEVRIVSGAKSPSA
jgi:SAM-dependent methyltransferase